MALFRISKGNEENLPKLKREGFAYFTVDENDFYIDTEGSETNPDGSFKLDANGNPIGGVRKQLNANRARYLKSKDTNLDGFHDLYIDDEEISLGRVKGESNYEDPYDGNSSKSGLRSIAVGNGASALGNYSSSFGSNTRANGINSHAEGSGSQSNGQSSHAEGVDTQATGDFSHAEGQTSFANGQASHAEGNSTTNGNYSHAEGNSTVASGENSHAQNLGTIANGVSQTALGKYNVADTTSAVIIGNGSSNDARSNIFTIDWNGNAFIANKITQGTPNTNTTIASANRFANDLFIGGLGNIPNSPKVAGIYLGKNSDSENRHMSIVSGGDLAYIDFNKASDANDYKVRFQVNASTGRVDLNWISGATNKEFYVNGKLFVNSNPSSNYEVTPKIYVDNFIKSVKLNEDNLIPRLIFTHGKGTTTAINTDYRVLQSEMSKYDNWATTKIPVLLSSPYVTVSNGGSNGVDISYWYEYFTFSPNTGYLEGVKIDCGTWEDYDSSVDDCCFEAGTQILVDLSGTTRNIEDMKPGDIAVAYDIQKGVNYLATVKDTHVKYDTTDIAEVVFNNGSKLTMNAYHPIYTTNGWHSLTNHKNYDTLIIGDVCRTESGWSEIVSINRYKSSNNITMYSLDLIDIDETNDNDTNDNFFANGIVVHNAGCPT